MSRSGRLLPASPRFDTRLARVLAMAAGVVWGLLPGTSAPASTRDREGNAVVHAGQRFAVYQAGAGEANRLTIRNAGKNIVVSDAGAPITVAPNAAARCSRRSEARVVCGPVDDDLFSLRVRLGDRGDTARISIGDLASVRSDVRLGDGNDTAHVSGDSTVDGGRGSDLVTASAGDARLSGGAGDDRLVSSARRFSVIDGGAGADQLVGGLAPDDLDGGGGSDLLQGGRGTDSLVGGPGRDDLHGGPGDDIVRYSVAHRAVIVTLDGRANDGEPRERDFVRRDVEGASLTVEQQPRDVVGQAPAGSRLIGNDRRNELYISGEVTADARGGNDHLSGAGRLLTGGPGADVIEARGAGRFHGGRGDDTLSKTDQANGGARLYGDAGADTIRSTELEQCDSPVEGSPWECSLTPLRDWVSCGPGRDTVFPDSKDRVSPDCERNKALR